MPEQTPGGTQQTIFDVIGPAEPYPGRAEIVQMAGEVRAAEGVSPVTCRTCGRYVQPSLPCATCGSEYTAVYGSRYTEAGLARLLQAVREQAREGDNPKGDHA